MMSWLWAGAARVVPRAIRLRPACARLWLDPDPSGRCWHELVVAQMCWGRLGTPPAQHAPRWLPKARHDTAPSLTHESQAVSLASLQCRGHGEAMGMGTLGHPGHGCYSARRKGGQSLLAPCKAAPMPARRASPLSRAHRLLRPAVPGWDGISAHPLQTQHRGGETGARGERGSPTSHIGRHHALLFMFLAAPWLNLAGEAPWG